MKHRVPKGTRVGGRGRCVDTAREMLHNPNKAVCPEQSRRHGQLTL
ncbi:hypothetical protein LEMLEM_LOCUS27873, partial [Lemmus lemmus]